LPLKRASKQPDRPSFGSREQGLDRCEGPSGPRPRIVILLTQAALFVLSGRSRPDRNLGPTAPAAQGSPAHFLSRSGLDAVGLVGPKLTGTVCERR
jgi:hypothetical protein